MKTLVTVLLLMALLGCKKGGYNQNEMARLTEQERKVVGKWTLERSYGGTESEGMKEVMELFEAMGGPVLLECLPNKTYTLVLLEIPVTGAWALEGTNVRLTIEKVGGMSPQDITRVEAKNRGVSGWDMSSAQREEFLKGMSNSMALAGAEGMTRLQMGVDGKSLYVVSQKSDSLFGSSLSVFRPSKQD